jgi:hypothetical protein
MESNYVSRAVMQMVLIIGSFPCGIQTLNEYALKNRAY